MTRAPQLERVTVEQGGALVVVRATAGAPSRTRRRARRPVVDPVADAVVAPGARVRIAARYRARIPERHGAFGCGRGQCTMAGFYPMPPRRRRRLGPWLRHRGPTPTPG
jgi:hypothetical protein